MADSPWLDDEQQRVWRLYLRVVRDTQECIEGQMQRQGGVPAAYYLILAMLSEAPDRRLRMNQLSDVLNSSQSRTSHAVARLEEQGLVRRVKAPHDGRGQIAELTDSGWSRLQELAPGHARTVRQAMFDALDSNDLAALHRILDKIASGQQAAAEQESRAAARN